MNLSFWQVTLSVGLGIFMADILTSVLRNGIAWVMYRRMRTQMKEDMAKFALSQPKVPKVVYDDDELPEVIN